MLLEQTINISVSGTTVLLVVSEHYTATVSKTCTDFEGGAHLHLISNVICVFICLGNSFLQGEQAPD